MFSYLSFHLLLPGYCDLSKDLRLDVKYILTLSKLVGKTNFFFFGQEKTHPISSWGFIFHCTNYKITLSYLVCGLCSF